MKPNPQNIYYMNRMAFEKILAFVNHRKEGSDHTVKDLKNWAHKREVEIEVITYDEIEAVKIRPEPTKCLAVTIGGDGTFLKSANKLASSKIPLLGVNLGSLGFLTHTQAKDLAQVLTKIWEGRHQIDSRMRLECKAKGKKFSCLNEVVLARGGVDHFTELELFIGDKLVGCYPGDGIIISTPTGSTAYSLSAGGPILASNLEGIAVTPLAPHTLGLRPVIFSAHEQIEVKANCQSTVLIDGDKYGTLSSGEAVKITQSPIPTRMVITKPRPNLFRTLHHKLEWGAGFCRRKRRS